eukprot:gnl/MRDRNA2_/MRDRNA2_25443_c0_seq1.p2 gnl/MRDRNA2_/MRDRNA2_25443_c0~~gnl/MRDRNA2_/MRDRNA2_25443_c0_seq1.p2  ORF type:complete len:100 (-),score=5.43 gnl/MRDRNA2_/MRDRNA2_25443_c0_seq1:258-557(-)
MTIALIAVEALSLHENLDSGQKTQKELWQTQNLVLSAQKVARGSNHRSLVVMAVRITVHQKKGKVKKIKRGISHATTTAASVLDSWPSVRGTTKSSTNA